MLDIFSGLRLVVKRRSISIDNAIFRCHWFFTSTLLVSFSLVITARQYVGQPIECHSFSKIPDSLLNSYCWVQSTFTVPQACSQQVGIEVPYPCIDNTRGREVKMYAYYQWVGMVLFIQGLLFHLPYYLWKVWENGLIKAITGGLRVAVLSDQERAKKKDIVVDYIHDHLGCHKRYAYKYFTCEFICLINLMLQLWATNKFFDGQFLRYGLDVMQYSSSSLSSQFGISQITSQSNSIRIQNATLSSSSSIHQDDSNNDNSNHENNNNKLENIQSPHQNPSRGSSNNANIRAQQQQQQVDPMTYIFPRITKCTYYNFGSSGDIQKHDALCLLPLNIINEKIYIALWFWFLVLAILTLLVIMYRLSAIVSESVRCKGLISRCKLSDERDIRVICRHCDVGDWFLFYMVAENLDPLIMREIVASIATKINAHFALKRELGMIPPDDDSGIGLPSGMQKGKQVHDHRYEPSSMSFDESVASSRRNSLADDVPFLKKPRKRFYSKRLWSVDLGSGEQRQQLFGNQLATNPEHLEPDAGHAGTLTSSGQVSAPPASLMPLDSMPLAALFDHKRLQRRGSLTRMLSTTSSTCSTASAGTTDSFVMEMQTISGSSSRLNNPQQPALVGDTGLRRQSSGRLLRHRTITQDLGDERSISAHHHSLRDLPSMAS